MPTLPLPPTDLPPVTTQPWKPSQAQLPSMRGVVELLERAKAKGLKWPKLWLALPDKTPVRVMIAGPNSRTPGYLMLTDGKPFGANLYFGKISPTGTLELGRDSFGDRRDPLLNLLVSLAQEPAKTAAQFGHMTGSCAFCGLPLSDARSIAVGYGPTCAQKYGMPWATSKKAQRFQLLED